MDTIHLTITLLYDGAKWVALFERQSTEGRAVCELFCGFSEPALPDFYAFLLQAYRSLEFSQPVAMDGDEADAQRKLNFKRMQRESRRLLENSDALVNVREATREECTLQKIVKKAEAKAEREAQAEYKYQRKQEQKKAKQRGY